MPYEVLDHTADWAMRVTAPDLEGLFIESARGMNALLGVKLALDDPRILVPGLRVSRTFKATAPDPESLLVTFLSELIYFAEHEHLAFDEFHVSISGPKLKAALSGAPFASIGRAIKAVTYHNMQIRRTKQGFEVEIVFDV